jgi:predicted nuclease of predicted toxin-antitoxin system
MRFLIDECLPPALTVIANQEGHEAQHVVHIGKAGWSDQNVVRLAAEGDFIVVTNNASDFRKLYATQPLHAGLIILLPNAGREVHMRLFKYALELLAANGEPVNQVLEMGFDGQDMIFTLYSLHKSSS